MPDRPEEAWRKGYLAGFDDLAASANPYKRGSLLAADWDDGWREGAHPRGRPAPREHGGAHGGAPRPVDFRSRQGRS